MKIGLIDIEPKIVNTAYMQIAAYHKQRGDEVGWWTPLTDRRFDHVYCSSLFTSTDKREIPQRAIMGGTGFDLSSRLSQAMEACDYDYSLYPKCDYSIVWFSRGCDHKCGGYCIVQEKEGKMHPVVPKQLNPKGKYVVVQDNSFFENPAWRAACDWLLETGQKVDITNINVRTITEAQCCALSNMPLCKQVKIAWDNPKQNLIDRIKFLTGFIPSWKVMVYVLIGYNSTPEEDLYRVETIKSLGCDPWVMPFNKKDPYQRKFARWGRPIICQSCKWEEYKYR